MSFVLTVQQQRAYSSPPADAAQRAASQPASQPASPLAAFRHTFGAGAKTFDGLFSHAAIALPSVPLCCVACEPVPLLCLRCVRRRASFGNSEDGRRQRAVETAFALPSIISSISTVSGSLGRVLYQASGHLPPHSYPAQHSTFTLLLLLLLFMHTQRAHLPLFHLPPSPSPFLRAAAARASKCTGMAAPCQRHVNLTRAGVEGFKKCFAKISRGGGVVPTSHRTLIEATTLASLPSLHTESNGPACATTSRVCNTCSHAGPPLQHICVGEKARPWPADDKRAQRFDVVHQPSRLASQTAPPDHQSGHPAATPRRTVKLSSETRLLTNNFLPTPRRTNLC
jgi:hypothetical protein